MASHPTPLALAPDRLGHGNSPDAAQDFEVGAELIAAMFAAARKPEMVRTLTVVEPPATKVARGNAVVDAWD